MIFKRSHWDGAKTHNQIPEPSKVSSELNQNKGDIKVMATNNYGKFWYS